MFQSLKQMWFDLCPSRDINFFSWRDTWVEVSPVATFVELNEIVWSPDSGLELWRKTAALDNFFNQAFYECEHLRKEMDNWVLLFGFASKSGVIRGNEGAKSAGVGKTHSAPIKGASPSWAMHTGANYGHTHVIYIAPFQNSLIIQPSRKYKVCII